MSKLMQKNYKCILYTSKHKAGNALICKKFHLNYCDYKTGNRQAYGRIKSEHLEFMFWNERFNNIPAFTCLDEFRTMSQVIYCLYL